MRNAPPYIAVEGPIGVGKTTLARILQEELGGQLLVEVFEENPFLSDFYQDRTRYAFQTQIFFLLSRYRQQYEVVSRVLTTSALTSDYLFAKDRLFAQLNLAGDELVVYEHVHAALAEKIVLPSLVIHLRATTDVLMNRIAVRDRSYERTMSRRYIDDLRLAYERFFADYDQAPLLTIDTDELDFVSRSEDRRSIVGLVRTALQRGPYQQAFPDLAPALEQSGAPILHDEGQRRLGDWQQLHRLLDRQQGLVPDLYLDFMLLSQQVGELGRQLAQLWRAEFRPPAGGAPPNPPQTAQVSLHDELVNTLTYLLKIANDAGVDLETAYVDQVGNRWQDSSHHRGEP